MIRLADARSRIRPPRRTVIAASAARKLAGEHLAFWPLGRVSDRFHPARNDLPVLTGNRRAFAQATIRHLLFGLVLGELERRVNVGSEPILYGGLADYSHNGHGSLEHAFSAEGSR